MRALLLAVPLLPLAGSVLLMLFGARLRETWVALVGCTTVGVSALIVLGLGAEWLRGPPEQVFTAPAWQWFSVAHLNVSPGLHLDGLSLVMAFVITFVGFFILLFSRDYMAGEEGFARFYAWMNLFVAAMLVLVLADDLALLYLGWEGVGLCSYLLIGFWYRDPANGYAARKAFVMTRLGDVGLLLGILVLALQFGTLRIDLVTERAATEWVVGAPLATLAAFLVLAGALGKSAQLPLHTWLPDAMAGPTPVSALIHAATMVTAGVYLIARLHELFELAPVVKMLVAALGAATLLLGAFSALAQRDIKRVLAYSTLSQIGYMFLALGLGAWSAAIFHLFTHAFFKALLFLAAGSVILALHHEQDLLRMGGLRKRLPLAFWSFVAGGASLAALPLVTAGFFSKERILDVAWSSPVLWGAAWLGAALTSAYVLRLIVLIFFGAPVGGAVTRRTTTVAAVPLMVLAVGSIVAGWIEWPAWSTGPRWFSHLLTAWLGDAHLQPPPIAVALAILAPFLGAAVWWFGRRYADRSPVQATAGFWREGWRVDRFYGWLFEQPWNELARRSAGEVLDGVYNAIVTLHRATWRMLSGGQNGVLRRYAGGLVLGTLFLLLMAL